MSPTILFSKRIWRGKKSVRGCAVYWANTAINLPHCHPIRKSNQWTAIYTCGLSSGPSPLMQLTEPCHLQSKFSWTQVTTKNEETWGQGGGNCARPSSPTPPLQPLQTSQSICKSASLQVNPGATCQAFCWPGPLRSGPRGSCCSQIPESCKKNIYLAEWATIATTLSRVMW